ncbi:MAG: hypothetical protein IJ704_03000 [Bacilli bacterium]|nr:hypothetical protein [Bacilli bacterium]
MATISGDQEGILQLLDCLDFIQDFDDDILKPIHFVSYIGQVTWKSEEYNYNNQVITVYGKGEKIHDSFLIKLYMNNQKLSRIDIQTAYYRIYHHENRIRKRYVNFQKITFLEDEYIDVKKEKYEYTLYSFPIFKELNTENHTMTERYKKNKMLYRVVDLPQIRTRKKK